MIWYKKNSNDDIMVSTRVRLARNVAKYPFPNVMTKQDIDGAKQDIISALENEKAVVGELKFTEMTDTDISERQVLMERHLISSELVEKSNAAVAVSADEELSIMLMEEDHIRIQSIMGGFALKEAYELANKADDAIEKHVEFAFSEKYGYLTACPTNTGTGMRASVMMHLPALTMTGNIDRIIRSASNLGLEVRGLYGEGSKAYGSLYQLSNRITLGLSEEEIIEKLENIAGQIKSREEEAREAIKDKTEVADRLWRSLGTLRYARSLTSREAKTLLSDYILGSSIGIIDEKIKQSPIELMVLTEPANITKIAGGADLSAAERDIKRAEIVRSSV
ncbi:MAG: protein arginine kinase [Eubacteriales bacterium]|nr:protein arginine kinase [Eubacteriales bacterium]